MAMTNLDLAKFSIRDNTDLYDEEEISLAQKELSGRDLPSLFVASTESESGSDEESGTITASGSEHVSVDPTY